MRINTNLTAMNTFNQVTKNQNNISSAVAKLSSGSAINSAADNAAGLAISEKMRAQIRGLDKASSNAQDAISLVQSAEGALDSSTTILQRMRELAVQSSSDTNNDSIDRSALQDEFSQLQKELNDISSNTTFNQKNLLNGDLAATKKNVDVTKLANSKTAISLGNASSGNYNFTVSTKQETAAVAGSTATATATMGTSAAATLDSVSATMNNTTEKTALYNGNYALSTSVDAKSGSITVTATGDNGKTFTHTLSSADLGTTAVSLNFETTPGAKDAFTVSLNLKAAADPTSENSLKTLASAINNVTVSVDKGEDATDATYGVYANITGGTSVKLNAGDTSVSFDNGVTVSFDKLTATDVATNAKASTLLTPVGADAAASTAVKGDATHTVSATYDFSALPTGLKSGDAFSIKLGNQTFSGTYKGETGDDLDKLIKNTISGVTYSGDAAAGTVTMDVSAGKVTFKGSTDGTANLTIGGATVTDGTETIANMSKPATGAAFTVTNGSSSGPEKLESGTTLNGAGNPWSSAAKGDKVYYSVGKTVIEGTYDGNADSTLATMLNGKSFTDDSGNSYAFTGVNAAHHATFTATKNGDLTDTTLKTAASMQATGYSATINDGLADKIGTANDKGSSSTTATTFSVTATANKGLTFQVGANEGDTMTLNIEKMDCQTLGVNSARVDTQAAAKAAITTVNSAINQVSAQRATLGAIQNRLQYKIDNLNTSNQNLTAAESQIRDVDMAKEMTAFTNANILSQASTAMLAQANSLPQSVLKLIGG